jgi:tellurite resistance protein TehA-like permease
VIRVRFVQSEPSPDLFPAVMATGIVSIAADAHRYGCLGIGLGILALVGFGGLAARFAVAAVTHRAQTAVLARDPDVALRMFSFVAACAVLAARWEDHPAAVWLLGGLALAGWLLLTPLATYDVAAWKSTDLRDHARGGWLLPSVATAGLAITATSLARQDRAPELVVVAVMAWIVAIVVYLAVVWLIGWRALASPFEPDQVTPDSWILMGALAITTLAGDHIIAAARALNPHAGIAHWTAPVTLGTWVLASLWVPALLYSHIWRINRRAGSLRYQHAWWAAVFPLGMYSAASAATATALHLRSLQAVSLVFFWIACTTWTLVMTGWLHTVKWCNTLTRMRSIGNSKQPTGRGSSRLLG